MQQSPSAFEFNERFLMVSQKKNGVKCCLYGVNQASLQALFLFHYVFIDYGGALLLWDVWNLHNKQ